MCTITIRRLVRLTISDLCIQSHWEYPMVVAVTLKDTFGMPFGEAEQDHPW
jgi:hypothetical protein